MEIGQRDRQQHHREDQTNHHEEGPHEDAEHRKEHLLEKIAASGMGSLTDEERRASKLLVYQVLPSRYGMNPDDLRRADAIAPIGRLEAIALAVLARNLSFAGIEIDAQNLSAHGRMLPP